MTTLMRYAVLLSPPRLTTNTNNIRYKHRAEDRSGSTESIETLVRVADEGQAHTGFLSTHGLVLSTQSSAVVGLRDLVDGEVLCIDCRRKFGLEGSTDTAKLIPDNAMEEGMLLDLSATSKATKAVVGITDQTIQVSKNVWTCGRWENLPADEVLCLRTNLLIRREVQVSRPIDDLAVGVMGFLCTEWGPSDQTLEHDGADTPPIAAVVVALATEDFGSDVIGSTNGRVCELAAGLAPGVDLMTVADSQLNLVE